MEICSLYCDYYSVNFFTALSILLCRFILTLTTWFLLSTRWVVLTTLVCMPDPDYDVDAEVAVDPQDRDYFTELYQQMLD